MIAALDDDDHVATQHATYAARRAVLKEAVIRAGFEVDHSEASLYLWATRGEACWETVTWFAERGILVAPGSFYGAAGSTPRPDRVHRDRRADRGGRHAAGAVGPFSGGQWSARAGRDGSPLA